MTDDNVRKALQAYRAKLAVLHVSAEHFPRDCRLPSETDPTGRWNASIAAHVLSMCDQIEQFLLDGRREKAMRWLGFIQGCLWSARYYTVNDFCTHNAPGRSVVE
jgi:hypothetical protein